MHRILASLALAGSLVLAPAVAGAADQTSDRPATDRPATDHAAETDVLRHPDGPRFRCQAHRSDRGPVIGCVWTPVGDDRAAGYRLWRSVDGGPRHVVFETRHNREHGHRELVRPGHRYRYAVQYLAQDGSVIATSHVEHVAIPAGGGR